MKKVAIIDYGMGNIDSVTRAVEKCEVEPLRVSDPKGLEAASNIILPGVGSFGDGMRNLREYGLETALIEQVRKRRIPILGICLGMQLFATRGFEGGQTEGLGWIDGEVKRFKPDQRDTKIPHVGWNEVNFEKASPLFVDISSGKDFYFMHSFHFICKNKEDAIACTPYCGDFVSAVGKGNIFGTQFHPEKSLRLGLKIIWNFCNYRF